MDEDFGLDFEDIPSPWEQYFWPGTTVLKNIPGLKDPRALEQFEHEASALRLAQLRLQPVTGNFDLQHMQSIHKVIFQDVYEWAGELREVNINKGGSDFTRLDQIHNQAASLARSLASENHLKDLDKPTFVDRLSLYYTGWNALHPFREGNGRATLEFMRQIADQAGYDFDRTKIDQSPGRWYNAAKECFNGNRDPIKNIFSDIVRPRVAVDVEMLSLQEAAKLHPQLQPIAKRLDSLESQLQDLYQHVPNKAAYLMKKVTSELIRQLDAGKPITALPKAIETTLGQAPRLGL